MTASLNETSIPATESHSQEFLIIRDIAQLISRGKGRLGIDLWAG